MRRQIGNLLVAALVVSAGLIGAVSLTAEGASKISRGAEISPVRVNLKGLNPALVNEGSYIVNAVGGCNDCHTAPPYKPGGNPFIGEKEQINAKCFLGGGTPFGPGIVSRNLTVTAHERSLEEFIDIMRHGTDYTDPADGTPILQVMPWPVYANMSDRELAAIFEYLKAIPQVVNTPQQPCVP